LKVSEGSSFADRLQQFGSSSEQDWYKHPQAWERRRLTLDAVVLSKSVVIPAIEHFRGITK
jgi:hypothetical protein